MKRNLAESDIIKEIIAHPDLLTVRQIGLTDIKTDDKTLFIIGNGFDLAHGVQSAYYNFRKFLYPKSHLRQVLDNCIDRPDIWSNLEESLAYLDRELMIDNIDTMLREFKAEDEDDEDFLYGNFYSAIDWALYPIDVIVNDLPRLFRKWINSLKTPKKLDSLFN